MFYAGCVFLFIAIQGILTNPVHRERCRAVGNRWSSGNALYWSIETNGYVYAYTFCKTGYSPISKILCKDGFWEQPLPQCITAPEEMCEPISIGQNVVKNCDANAPKIGSRCSFRCLKGLQIAGSEERRCDPNLRWSGTSTQCVPAMNRTAANNASTPQLTDPCEVENGGCEQICDGRTGVAHCSCRHGFIAITRTTCRAINKTRPSLRQWSADPCKVNNGGCDQSCKSRSGVVQCSCSTGYIPRNRTKCIDIDECATNNGNCSHYCVNIAGGHHCSCAREYRLALDQRTCVSIYGTHSTADNTSTQQLTDPCEVNNGGCVQLCDNRTGVAQCSCYPGYYLIHGRYCRDIDECTTNNGNCTQHCVNTAGGHHCSCVPGYHLAADRRTCEDVDECRGGVCNQRCENTLGSYSCSCEPGYILRDPHTCEGCRRHSYRSEGNSSCIECPANSFTDSEAKASVADCHCAHGYVGDPTSHVPCTDIDECANANFGCSHTCLNTPGGALCMCPAGFQLSGDGKTCVDIDECSIRNGGCQMQCQNTNGSFNCSCSKGYILSQDTYSCEDVDECAEKIGDCSDICNNFPGSFFCTCRRGRRLDVDGRTCFDVVCPAVSAPHHSELRCFPKRNSNEKIFIKPHNSTLEAGHPVDTICRVKCKKGYNTTTPVNDIHCLDDGTWNASTPMCTALQCTALTNPEHGSVYPPSCIQGPVPVKQQCYYTCDPGYSLSGKKGMLKCRNDLTWNSDPPVCKADLISPFVMCPDDATVELVPNENMASIFIERPITNMEEVEVFPHWITLNESTFFPSGRTDVHFKVDNGHVKSECVMTVNVIDKEPPIFVQCPDSFAIDGAGAHGVHVQWEEPIALDNVAIHSLDKNLEPNSRLSAGIHHVEYIARDEAGNTANCSFRITVRRGYCEDLDDPENGKANCIDWLMGNKLCRPNCDPGFERLATEPKLFVCGDSLVWTPLNTISPCFEKCSNGTTWSTTSESCE